MKIRHIIQESGQALRTNLLRSSLTIVGIVVGIFAVTAMLALGEGLSQNIIGRISSFSQGDISIQGALSRQDLTWISEQPYVQAAIGTLSISGADVIIGGEDYNVTVSSVLGDFMTVQKFSVLKGEAFDFKDIGFQEQKLVATSDLETKVIEDTGQSLVGQFISVGGQRYEVIGILDIDSPGFSRSDGAVYVPYQTAIGTLSNTSNFGGIGVSLKDSSDFEIAGKHVLEGLNASRFLAPDSDDIFSVSTAQSIIESAQETTSMISLFLGIVGGIALFVGGIGTMNMMLTTVTERTKEIGLRKAIGARRRDILLQILIESVFLTSIGGIIGIALTAILAIFANNALANLSSVITVIVSWNVVMLATGVAVAIGIVFGLYPANSASKLQPVDALRAE
jgi:putative ABC transport system permease protein